jgi:hypothetical protein
MYSVRCIGVPKLKSLMFAVMNSALSEATAFKRIFIDVMPSSRPSGPGNQISLHHMYLERYSFAPPSFTLILIDTILPLSFLSHWMNFFVSVNTENRCPFKILFSFLVWVNFVLAAWCFSLQSLPLPHLD